ncbi:hypothetical protein ACLOJK_011511 [Asimina triloba]
MVMRFTQDRILMLIGDSMIIAAKIIANLIVMGSGILARAFVQAYRQALAILGMRNQPEEELIRTVILLNAYICPDSAVAWEIVDASKTGVAQETIQNTVRRASKTMTEQEARQILGVSESSSWEEILQAAVAVSSP